MESREGPARPGSSLLRLSSSGLQCDPAASFLLQGAGSDPPCAPRCRAEGAAEPSGYWGERAGGSTPTVRRTLSFGWQRACWPRHTGFRGGGGQRQGWSQGGAGPGVSGLPRGEAPVEGFTPRRSPGHRPGWSTPERVNEACGQQAWLRGLDQPGSFLPFRAPSSPGLLLLQQMVGPEPGAPRSPGPLRRPRAAWWRVGGGDVAYAVLAGWPARGRPGGLTHRELRAQQNGAQLL